MKIIMLIIFVVKKKSPANGGTLKLSGNQNQLFGVISLL